MFVGDGGVLWSILLVSYAASDSRAPLWTDAVHLRAGACDGRFHLHTSKLHDMLCIVFI